MTESQRKQAIRLHYDEHLPLSAIAERIGVPVGDVRAAIAATFATPAESQLEARRK